jgi:hypothetical protein
MNGEAKSVGCKTLSEKLKIKIEHDLGYKVLRGPSRIWGVKGAAHRWSVKLDVVGEISSEDTMAESVKSGKLHILQDGMHRYISV